MHMSHGVSNWIMWGYLDYYKNAVQLFGYDPEVHPTVMMSVLCRVSTVDTMGTIWGSTEMLHVLL